MSVTNAALRFHPAHIAGHPRTAGLRGAGCLPLRNTRLLRSAAAAPPPVQAGAHGTAPRSAYARRKVPELDHQLPDMRPVKQLVEPISLFMAIVCFMCGDFYGGCVFLFCVVLVRLMQ